MALWSYRRFIRDVKIGFRTCRIELVNRELGNLNWMWNWRCGELTVKCCADFRLCRCQHP